MTFLISFNQIITKYEKTLLAFKPIWVFDTPDGICETKNEPFVKFINGDNFPKSSYIGAISSWSFSGEVEAPQIT